MVGGRREGDAEHGIAKEEERVILEPKKSVLGNNFESKKENYTCTSGKEALHPQADTIMLDGAPGRWETRVSFF